MVEEPIEAAFFNWLCAMVLSVDHPLYDDLMQILYKTEFVWMIPGDQNREEDGLELRIDFLRDFELENEPDWFASPCSIFEMLVALAKRAAFQTDMSIQDWFWIFITNLGLDEYRRVPRSDVARIEEILYTFVWRTYSPHGDGGLFPMRQTERDQRKVELWFQCCEWIDDQGLI